jgi:hypothetical protein
MSSQEAAARYIRALLAGSSPNGIHPEAFGKYQDIIETLVLAFSAGDTPKLDFGPF